MKAKEAFSKIIQPELVQYMIENYGKSYDTVKSVLHSWRTDYPVSDEIIEDVFVRIKTIEKTQLKEQNYKSEAYQTGLTQIIADYLYKFVRRLEIHKWVSKAELKAMIKQNVDISENKTKKAQFVMKLATPEFVYISDVSKTEKNITTEVQDVLWHLYKHNNLQNRRLFYRDILGKISEIQHENGIFKNFSEGHFKDIQ